MKKSKIAREITPAPTNVIFTAFFGSATSALAASTADAAVLAALICEASRHATG
ncbi:hypothetical protein D3C76_1634940 [compost metagenome]